MIKIKNILFKDQNLTTVSETENRNDSETITAQCHK